jgi:uncharacterized membrane protein YbhN (UPF0104 family)
MKRTVLTLTKLLVSVGLIAWIGRSIDAAALMNALRLVSMSSLAFAAGLVALQSLTIGWRWHRIVALLGGKLPAHKAVEWAFVGLFFNNVLPTSVGGDAVRIWLLRSGGATLRLAVASVVIERGTGIALLGLLISACVPMIWATVPDQSMRVALAATGPVLCAALVLAAFADKLVSGRMPASVARPFIVLGEGLRSLGEHPRSLLEIAALGILASLTGLVAAIVLGESLGIGLSLPAYIGLVGGALLLAVLPVSLGGWGVRELAMVALLGAAGVSTERALALSLVWGLLPLAVSLPFGLLWWLRGPARKASDAAIAAGVAPLPAARASDHR